MDIDEPIAWKMIFKADDRTYVTDKSILIDQRYVFPVDQLPDGGPQGAGRGGQLRRKRNYSVFRNVLALPAFQRFRVADLTVKNEWLCRYSNLITLNRKYIAFLRQRIPEDHLVFALSGGSGSPVHLYRDDEHIGILLPVSDPEGPDDAPVEIARAGDAKAQYSMALRYHIRAYKSAASAAKALKWYAAAAEQGYAPACLSLGRCFWEGLLVDRDYTKSLVLMDRAIELGSKEAVRWRSALIKDMPAEQYRRISARMAVEMMSVASRNKHW